MAASVYACQRVALLTQHGKERVIAPVLDPALGCAVTLVTGYDTDQLGTFTREIPRAGSQLDAARRKARLGMALSGLPVGLASEGSFGPDPMTGLFPWNVELLIWIDDRLGIEVLAQAQGPASAGFWQGRDWDGLETFARAEGYPAQHLVLRPADTADGRWHKGLEDWDALRAAFAQCQASATQGQVVAEADLRAFANPRRMSRIAEAAQDLLQRLQSACPAFHTPGFAVRERRGELPCEDCGLPTRLFRDEVWACVRCTHVDVRPRRDRTLAESRHCAYCNP